ncbi:MAG: nucleotidyltransferase domain-containing protein [Armatimonadota bacterium]|nr:nucleotidyltransferase domain-containing protein [Armatimonadota bacterium]
MGRFTLSREEKERVRERLRAVLAPRSEVLFAYLHGSFLQDVPFEDVDVAVYLGGGDVVVEDSLQYAFRLADEVERQIGLPVDVQVMNHAPRGVQFSATAGELLVCRDEEFRCNFVERLWLEIMDFDYHARQMLKEAFQR